MSALCRHGNAAHSARNVWVLTVISIGSWLLPSRTVAETSDECKQSRTGFTKPSKAVTEECDAESRGRIHASRERGQAEQPPRRRILEEGVVEEAVHRDHDETHPADET